MAVFYACLFGGFFMKHSKKFFCFAYKPKTDCELIRSTKPDKAILDALYSKLNKANSNNTVVSDGNTVVVLDKYKHSGAHSGNSEVYFVIEDTDLSIDDSPYANRC